MGTLRNIILCDWPNHTAWTLCIYIQVQFLVALWVTSSTGSAFRWIYRLSIVTGQWIPQGVWKRATVVEEEDKKYYRMDIVWHHLSTMLAADSTHRFARLVRIANLEVSFNYPTFQCTRRAHMFHGTEKQDCFQTQFRPKGNPFQYINHQTGKHWTSPLFWTIKRCSEEGKVCNMGV